MSYCSVDPLLSLITYNRWIVLSQYNVTIKTIILKWEEKKEFIELTKKCNYLDIASWHWACVHVHIVLSSMQEADNEIPNQVQLLF